MATWNEFTTEMAYCAPRVLALYFFLAVLIVVAWLGYRLYVNVRMLLIYLALRRFQKRSRERRAAMRESVNELERVLAERRAHRDEPQP